MVNIKLLDDNYIFFDKSCKTKFFSFYIKLNFISSDEFFEFKNKCIIKKFNFKSIDNLLIIFVKINEIEKLNFKIKTIKNIYNLLNMYKLINKNYIFLNESMIEKVYSHNKFDINDSNIYWDVSKFDEKLKNHKITVMNIEEFEKEKHKGLADKRTYEEYINDVVLFGGNHEEETLYHFLIILYKCNINVNKIYDNGCEKDNNDGFCINKKDIVASVDYYLYLDNDIIIPLEIKNTIKDIPEWNFKKKQTDEYLKIDNNSLMLFVHNINDIRDNKVSRTISTELFSLLKYKWLKNYPIGLGPYGDDKLCYKFPNKHLTKFKIYDDCGDIRFIKAFIKNIFKL